MSSTAEACFCGTDSIGICLSCQRRFCGIHSDIRGGRRLCDDCWSEELARRADQATAERNAEEQRFKDLFAEFDRLRNNVGRANARPPDLMEHTGAYRRKRLTKICTVHGEMCAWVRATEGLDRDQVFSLPCWRLFSSKCTRDGAYDSTWTTHYEIVLLQTGVCAAIESGLFDEHRRRTPGKAGLICGPARLHNAFQTNSHSWFGAGWKLVSHADLESAISSLSRSSR
jgi:hypothetical protein